jgi:hypothetical protein
MSQPEFDFEARPKKTAAELPGQVLEKIKKLLRLSESSNPHEAALAMGRAMEMANRHNLDISTLDTDEEMAPIIHKWFPAGGTVPMELRLAVRIAHSYFNVTPCYAFKRYMLVGREADIAIAEYVIAFMVASYRRCARTFEAREKATRRRMSTRKRIGYRAGFFYGISSQLAEKHEAFILEDARFAIVLADQEEKRKQSMHELVGETSPVKTRKQDKNKSAVWAGFVEGSRLNLQSGLGSPSTGKTLLLQ